MDKTLIIGNGEIGSSLYNILNKQYEVQIKDKEHLSVDFVGVLHICYPYSDKFIDYTRQYIKEYNPIYTVIHSTVPVGTSGKLGAYHSPVRGVHPHLEKGIKTFVKYLAPKNKYLKSYFENTGIKIKQLESPRMTELGKMLSTTYYGVCIAFHAYAKKLADKVDVDLSIVMDEFNSTYNEGYKKLGMENVVRPILYPPNDDQIFGHCICENSQLLEDVYGEDCLLNTEEQR